MATAFYVFNTFKDYQKLYVMETLTQPTRHTPIIDMYFKDKKHLWVATNIPGILEHPRLTRTIVHFYHGNIDKHLKGDEDLVKHGSIEYIPHKQKIRFNSDKNVYEFPVARYIGSKKIDKSMFRTKKYPINYDYRFYDMVNDRINFILEDTPGTIAK